MHVASPRFSPLRRAACLLAVAMLTACSGMSGVGTVVTPYKIDILQGNVVTREQAKALAPGMTRPQVADILGTPLLTSVFHADRWDYVFSIRRQGLEPQQRRLTVFFKGDALERTEADELPSESEFVSSLQGRRNFDPVPPLQASEAQLKAFKDKNVGAAPAPAPAAPATIYPPLEAPAR
jgi:outer membrane protein assembly factor BamE